MNSYYNGVDNSAYLAHYGVLGMKWGIRRTPEQLGHRTIKAGTTFYRQTANADETHSGNKYVSYADPDRDFYKGRAKSWISQGDIYQKTYKAVTDIIAPSYETTVDAINTVIRDNPKVATRALTKEYVHLNAERLGEDIYYGSMSQTERDQDDAWDKAYAKGKVAAAKEFRKKYENGDISQRNTLMISSAALGVDKEYQTLVGKELAKRGYNAITDLTGQGFSYREGYDPLIVLNVESALAEVSTHKVSQAESDKASMAYNSWYRKNVNTGINNYR